MKWDDKLVDNNWEHSKIKKVKDIMRTESLMTTLDILGLLLSTAHLDILTHTHK